MCRTFFHIFNYYFAIFLQLPSFRGRRVGPFSLPARAVPVDRADPGRPRAGAGQVPAEPGAQARPRLPAPQRPADRGGRRSPGPAGAVGAGGIRLPGGRQGGGAGAGAGGAQAGRRRSARLALLARYEDIFFKKKKSYFHTVCFYVYF